ncbi:MAG TPA: HAD family phosphatase, partial [Solirubrobacterales bacterium]
MQLEAIVFDAEGVIIDTETVWDEGQRIFLARRGIEYEREEVKVLLTGRSLSDGARTLKQLYGIPGEPEELARERADIVRELMSTVDFVPGFEPFYERIRNEYRTCVATAMADDLFDIVDRRLGIRRLFDDRVFMLSDVGFRSKPDPALFLHAATQIETPPTACVVIEDSP